MARPAALIFALLLAFGPDAGSAGAQDPAAQADETARGQLLYEKHCRRCHRADSLAARLYPQGVEQTRRDFCRFLQSHRHNAEAQDCAIITYLESLAPASAQ